MVFTDDDRMQMLIATYAIDEIADMIDYMPAAPTREALTAMYWDVCPSGPPPPKANWASLPRDIDYAATYYAHAAMRYGLESIAVEKAFYEAQARESEFYA